MALILKHKSNRIAFQFGRQSGLRSTDEVVEQLRAQLQAERAQHRLVLTEKECELGGLRYQLAKRDRQDAFVVAPSPSPSVH